MAIFVKPDLNELQFRKKLYENKRTMAYQNGIVPFPKEEWNDFYETHVLADEKQEFYRFLFCRHCNDFVGEASWKYNHDKQRYEIHVLVEYNQRKNGYGKSMIENLVEQAKADGIPSLYAIVEETNDSAGFFLHMGFQKIKEENHQIVMRYNICYPS